MLKIYVLKIYVLLAALGISVAPAHAYTITADGEFTVEFVGDDEVPVDPPYTESGSFSLRENRTQISIKPTTAKQNSLVSGLSVKALPLGGSVLPSLAVSLHQSLL